MAVAVVWTTTNTREGDYYVLRTDDIRVIAAFDFVVALLIGVVTVLLGQAMTRNEVFTGKALLQRGLGRHCTQAMALATGYGVLLGGALVLGVEETAQMLPPLKAETLYFAGRELVRNAARHARPARDEGRRLMVTAECPDGLVRVTIEDNGCGWDGLALPGHGLELHTALLAIAGGSLAVEGREGSGGRGVLVLPLSD